MLDLSCQRAAMPLVPSDLANLKHLRAKLRRGADPDAAFTIDDNKVTPLYFCSLLGLHQSVDILIQHREQRDARRAGVKLERLKEPEAGEEGDRGIDDRGEHAQGRRKYEGHRVAQEKNSQTW